MKVRLIASLAVLFAMVSPSAAATRVYQLPSYMVVVTLSKKADAKVSAAKELVHINAHYFGLPVDAKDGDKNGEVALADEDADISGSSAAVFGKAVFDQRAFSKIYDGSPRVHITVTAGKKLFGADELSCTEFKDTLPTTPLPRIPISCELTGEKPPAKADPAATAATKSGG